MVKCSKSFIAIEWKNEQVFESETPFLNYLKPPWKTITNGSFLAAKLLFVVVFNGGFKSLKIATFNASNLLANDSTDGFHAGTKFQIIWRL